MRGTILRIQLRRRFHGLSNPDVAKEDEIPTDN